MRVITGTAKGRRLRSIDGLATRPTTDRVKENLFNIIGPYLDGLDFLDLFAGSGSIGIEAKSRGANRVVMVERSRSCLQVIRANLEHTGLEAQVVSGSIPQVLSVVRARHGQFHIVFMDPPYQRGLTETTLAASAHHGLLAEGGLLVAEYSAKEEIPRQLLNLEAVRTETYADTCLGFFRHKED